MAEEEETPTVIYGDLLDAVISHLPLIDLLPAYHVSKDWRSAVLCSASNFSRSKPWLIAHIQNIRNPSLLLSHAYDPNSQSWIKLPGFTASSPLRSCQQQNFIYTLTPSKLRFSVDPLNAKWEEVEGPKVWRLDPIVAMVGSEIVVAGGSYDFEDDRLAVEIYDFESRKWELCQSMPDIFKDCAFTTGISVAVWNDRMFFLEKSSCIVCVFDAKARSWGNATILRPNPSLFFSLIGFVNGRLVLIGLLGDSESVEGLSIWEVNCETFSCSEIGKMPLEMLKRLIDSCEIFSSVAISTANDFLYIYNGSGGKEIFFCEISNSFCHWGCVQNLVDDGDCLFHRFVVNCSQVGFSDVQRAFIG